MLRRRGHRVVFVVEDRPLEILEVLHDGGVGEERQPSVVARAAVGLATAFVCGAYRHPEAAILNNEIRSGRTTRRHDEEPA